MEIVATLIRGQQLQQYYLSIFFEQNPDLFDEIFIALKRHVLDGHRNLLHTIRLCQTGWGGEINKMKMAQLLESQP